MAAPLGIALTDEHRRRVAEGEIGLSALAAELNCSRQSLFTAFRRRNWPTTAAPAALHQADKVEIAPKAPGRRVERQEPLPASSCPPAPNRLPAASAAPPAAIPVTTAAELAEFARQQVASVALLVLGQLQDQLASTRLGPGALKAGVQAALAAADLLHRAGIMLDQEQAEVPKMIFEEYSAAECEALRAQAEAEHGGLFIPHDERDESDQSEDQ